MFHLQPERFSFFVAANENQFSCVGPLRHRIVVEHEGCSPSPPCLCEAQRRPVVKHFSYIGHASRIVGALNLNRARASSVVSTTGPIPLTGAIRLVQSRRHSEVVLRRRRAPLSPWVSPPLSGDATKRTDQKNDSARSGSEVDQKACERIDHHHRHHHRRASPRYSITNGFRRMPRRRIRSPVFTHS